ncbi:MAG: DUF5658 family protein [Phycisphaerales bacterium]|nr:DUF5658 family protein [Phycisphaerales bacterium]
MAAIASVLPSDLAPSSGPAAIDPAPTPAARPAASPERRRSLRVLTLLTAIVFMSLGDLYMTLVHLSTIGMGEANPIARYVIGFNSPALLAVWKLSSVLLACLIFAKFRTRVSTEAACWLCTGVLVVLTLMWINYSAEITTLTCSLPAITQAEYSAWVHITD